MKRLAIVAATLALLGASDQANWSEWAANRVALEVTGILLNGCPFGDDFEREHGACVEISGTTTDVEVRRAIDRVLNPHMAPEEHLLLDPQAWEEGDDDIIAYRFIGILPHDKHVHTLSVTLRGIPSGYGLSVVDLGQFEPPH